MYYLPRSLFVSFSIGISLVVFVSGEIIFKKGAPHVKLNEKAELSGTTKFSRNGRPFSSFEGIQYARIPERFGSPELIADSEWEGEKSATEPGPRCIQQGFGGQVWNDSGEDCLYLNVYVPMNEKVGVDASKKENGIPVMVWIHGGGFFFGSGGDYGPTYFMDEDVILVTINYRLGVFGFLSTGDEVIPGNNGLKDILQALRWVKQNIKAFGGNSDNGITVFGESAGSVASHFLLLSPQTEGLFHRVISQSGSALYGLIPNPREIAVNLASHLKCPMSSSDPLDITSEEIRTCLKEVPKDELNNAQFEVSGTESAMDRYGPVAEPKSSNDAFISEHPLSLQNDKTRRLKNVPWMIGLTEDEMACMAESIVTYQEDVVKDMNENWADVIAPAFNMYRYFNKEEQTVVANKMKQFYFEEDGKVSPDTSDVLSNMYSDAMIGYDVEKSAVDVAAMRGNKVFLYQYAYRGPVSFMGFAMNVKGKAAEKVGHADEVQHLFDKSGMMPGEMEPTVKPDTPHEEFSKNLVKLWASFAIHGEPSHSWGSARDEKWTPISSEEATGARPLRWYRIDENPRFVDHPYKERSEFWKSLWAEHYEPKMLEISKNKSGDVGKTEL